MRCLLSILFLLPCFFGFADDSLKVVIRKKAKTQELELERITSVDLLDYYPLEGEILSMNDSVFQIHCAFLNESIWRDTTYTIKRSYISSIYYCTLKKVDNCRKQKKGIGGLVNMAGLSTTIFSLSNPEYQSYAIWSAGVVLINYGIHWLRHGTRKYDMYRWQFHDKLIYEFD